VSCSHPWTGLLAIFQECTDQGGPCALTVISAIGGLFTDGAVRSLLVVVPTPSLAFSLCIVEAHEPSGRSGTLPGTCVKGLDERICRSAFPGREKSSVSRADSPQIQIP